MPAAAFLGLGTPIFPLHTEPQFPRLIGPSPPSVNLVNIVHPAFPLELRCWSLLTLSRNFFYFLSDLIFWLIHLLTSYLLLLGQQPPDPVMGFSAFLNAVQLS